MAQEAATFKADPKYWRMLEEISAEIGEGGKTAALRYAIKETHARLVGKIERNHHESIPAGSDRPDGCRSGPIGH
jgi:hypothetical protein